MNEIAANVLKEDPRAIARLITFTENQENLEKKVKR